MKPTVLLYNIDDKTRLLKFYQALLPLGFRMKLVEKTEYGLPLGVLAGVDCMEERKTDEKVADFSDEMAVMAGFSSGQVDAFILALRKHGLGRIDYKAVLTPTNRTWDSVKLYQEIKKEHESMNGKT